jgi:hypothetical protein
MPEIPEPKLEAYYSIRELVEITGKSRGRVERLLAHAGIHWRRMGGQRIVFVSDIEVRLPELWASMVACERARAVSRALERLSGAAK